jgi:hypothetical protein
VVRVYRRPNSAGIGRLTAILPDPGSPLGLVAYIFRIDPPTVYTDREVVEGVKLFPAAAEFTVILALLIDLEFSQCRTRIA